MATKKRRVQKRAKKTTTKSTTKKRATVKTTKKQISSKKPLLATLSIVIGIPFLFFIVMTLFTASQAAVEEGSEVTISYTGTLDDGTVFDTSEGKEPLTFTVGSGQVIKGFDEGVRGMKVGEKKTISIEPDSAYGSYDDTKILEIPREKVPESEKVNVGDRIFMVTATGGQTLAIIKEIKEETFIIDFNHPLTGKTLTFDVELLSLA